MIRPARPKDAADILQIWNEEIRQSFATFTSVAKTRADLEHMISKKSALGHAFLVFERKGHVVGFATYGQFRGGMGYRHTAELTVYLHPAARGEGVGRLLLAALEDHAQRAGYHSMWAGISAANPAAAAFHERLGYERIAVLPEVGRKFDQWIDLILMQKRL